MCSAKISELSRVTAKSQTLDKKEMTGNSQKVKRNQASGAAEGYPTR